MCRQSGNRVSSVLSRPKCTDYKQEIQKTCSLFHSQEPSFVKKKAEIIENEIEIVNS